jgi:CubicO group peptidase (beta-lactamase class C family)
MSEHGFVLPGFEPVRDEFERNFSERGEVGAAFAAYHDGRLVVDLWGGRADTRSGRMWRGDTTCPIFSGSKGLIAGCILKQIERGELALDTPVAHYWPEFAAAGKADILVRHVVSHTAGLPGLEAPVSVDELTDPRLLCELLAGQAPLLNPGGAICYHPLTYGWLCGELIRRTDGRSLADFFADEFATPLGLEVRFGVTGGLRDRVAVLEFHPAWPDPTLAAPAGRKELARIVWANPDVFGRDREAWNSPEYHAAGIPGAGAIGTARSIARLYGCLARGGELDGVRLLDEETIRMARTGLSHGPDHIFGDDGAFGVGFALQVDARELGPPADAFGHGGAGGSMHGAWPTDRVGFSYCMNQLRESESGPDDRPAGLLKALFDAVANAGRDGQQAAG